MRPAFRALCRWYIVSSMALSSATRLISLKWAGGKRCPGSVRCIENGVAGREGRVTRTRNGIKKESEKKNNCKRKEGAYALVVHNCRRTDELVDVGVALALELRDVALRVLDDRSDARGHTSAHIADRLQARHLVANRRLSREQVVLVRPQPLAVERHRLRERR